MTEALLARAVDMMIKANIGHRHLIDACVSDIGIHRTHHRILMRLYRHGALPSQKELAEHLGITPAAVTGALKRLEKDGYIERTLGHDNRFNEVKITDKGRELVALTHERFSAVDNSVFEGFTDDELTAYISILEKMQKNLERHLQERRKA